MKRTPDPENDGNEYNPVFNKEEQEKISSLERLIKARKNLLNDIDMYKPKSNNIDDEEDDNDGLKEYRGIF
jgi:hypothetical protein